MPSGPRASGSPAATQPTRTGRDKGPPAGVSASDTSQDMRHAAPSTPVPPAAEADASAAIVPIGSGKKRRVLSACVRCAAKKVKCDGRKPCSVCSSLSLGDQCHFNPNPKKRGPPKGYWDAQRKMRKEAGAHAGPSTDTEPLPHVDIDVQVDRLRKRKRLGAQSSGSPSTSGPPPSGPAPWQRYTEPAGLEFPSSMHKFRSQALPTEAGATSEAASPAAPARPRLPPLAEMHASELPPPLREPRRAIPKSPPVPPNMFHLNPPPPAVHEGPVQDPSTLTPYESRLIEIYIAFVHDHWPLLAPNILFAPGLGNSAPNPAQVVGVPTSPATRPQTLTTYIASLKGRIPLLFQLICCTAANTLMQNCSGKGANIVAGIPVQPGEIVTGKDLDQLVDKCRVALMPFAHVRAIWVVQALFLLALADYSAGRMHEGWQSTGLVCRLVVDMNLHRSQGEVAVRRMMRLANGGTKTATQSTSAGRPCPRRFVQTMLADIALEELLIAQEERAMYAAAGAYTVGEIIQVRRRVFWSSFVLDKFVSVLTERPCMLRCAEVDVSFPNPSSLDDTQPWLTWSSVMFVQPNVIPELKGVPARIDTCFSVVSQLCVITEHILDVLYSSSQQSVPTVPDLTRTEHAASSDSLSTAESNVGCGDEAGVTASRWLAETLALSGNLGDNVFPPDPDSCLAESYLRIMRMLTLWSEYMPARMRGRRMPLTYAQPLPPDADPLGPTDLFVMSPSHSGSPPSFLSMRAWTHLNILLLHRPFVVRPHLLSFSLSQLRNYGFAPTLSAERTSQQDGTTGRHHQETPSKKHQHAPSQPLHPDATGGIPSSLSLPTSSRKRPAQMKVSITSLLVEQRRHRAKSTTSPVAGTGEGQRLAGSATTGPSAALTHPGRAGRSSAFLLPLSHAAQVCIQAAAEIIDIADVYQGLYPPRKLPHIWVFMLFQAGTVISPFSINMTPVLSTSDPDERPSEPVDSEWLKRAHETAARCRSLLSRCLASLQVIEVSHPSARELVRILNSLAEVAGGVDTAASSRAPPPSARSPRSDTRDLDFGLNTTTGAAQSDSLTLLTGQAVTEAADAGGIQADRSRPLAPNPPHPRNGPTTTTQARTDYVDLAAWKPFWDLMPFGANWDSWRQFFVKMAQDDLRKGDDAGAR